MMYINSYLPTVRNQLKALRAGVCQYWKLLSDNRTNKFSELQEPEKP